MPKKADIDIIADAYIVYTGEYLSYDTSETVKDPHPDQLILHSRIPNPEKLLLRKDTLEKLSPEAIEIINIILYSPEEILDSLGFTRITKRGVRLYFSKIWMSKWITKHTIDEITKWVNQL